MNSIDMKNRKLYNKNLKAQYLNEILNANTRNTTYFDLIKISYVERKLNKNANEFNDSDISTLLKNMSSSSILSIRRMLSTLNDYVEWINPKLNLGKGKKNNIQHFIAKNADLNRFVSNKQINGKLLSGIQFDDLLNILINPIDVALILCMYNFIGGEDFYEIRSMTRDSIDVKNNQICLTDKDGATRTQTVSSELIDELILLDKTPVYISNNGEEDTMGRIKELNFIDSRFLFKPTKLVKESEMMATSTIYTKLKQIQKHTGYNYITPTSLRDTRLIHEVLYEASLNNMCIPNQQIIRLVLDNMRIKYGLYFSHMQKYGLEQKILKILYNNKPNKTTRVGIYHDYKKK